MISEKIFAIKNLVFNLPDNFDGDLTDALEEIVKYRKSKEAIQKRHIDLEQQEKNEKGQFRSFDNAVNMHLKSDFKLSLEVFGSYYNKDKKEFEPKYFDIGETKNKEE